MPQTNATIMAGIPAINSALYRMLRFNVGDPVALIQIPNDADTTSIFILRDIEMRNLFLHKLYM